jgi:hypothetical protein
MLSENGWKLEFYCMTHHSEWRTHYSGSAQAVKEKNIEKVGSSLGRDAKTAKGSKQRAGNASAKGISMKTPVTDACKRSRLLSMCLADDDEVRQPAKHFKLAVVRSSSSELSKTVSRTTERSSISYP